MNLEQEKIKYSELALRYRHAMQAGNKKLANKLAKRCAQQRKKWASRA